MTMLKNCKPAKVSVKEWTICDVCDDAKEKVIRVERPNVMFFVCLDCAKVLSHFCDDDVVEKVW